MDNQSLLPTVEENILDCRLGKKKISIVEHDYCHGWTKTKKYFK